MSVATPQLGDQPPQHQRKPLLTGPAPHRPTGHSHTGPGTEQCPEDADRRGMRTQDEDTEHQPGGHRPDLSASPTGDKTPLFQGTEAVAHSLGAHRGFRHAHVFGVSGWAACDPDGNPAEPEVSSSPGDASPRMTALKL